MNLADRYEVLYKIGAGGGGEVYAVQDSFLSKKLALKLSKPQNETEKQSFYQEYQINSRLTSQNLARVYDFGYTGENDAFYTMDLLPAGNLEECLKGCESQKLLQAAYKISKAVSFLHFFNIVHGDLKPENIKLIETSDDFNVKLLDMGLSSTFDPENPNARMSGTVEYMAPELFRNEPMQPSCDLYSLGVIFYQLLTGKLPFTSTDPLVLISDKLERPAPEITTAPTDCPREFIDLTTKLLSTSPAKRNLTAFEVTRRIGKIIEQTQTLPDFADLLKSAVGLKLAGLFEETQFQNEKVQTYLFTDPIILQTFLKLVKTHLQSKYFNVEVCDEIFAQNSCTPQVSPLASLNARIDLYRVEPEETFTVPANDNEHVQFNLLLVPCNGTYTIKGDFQKFQFDMVTDIHAWFDKDNLAPEISDKLTDISSAGLDILAVILNRMQADEIVQFNGTNWQVKTDQFLDYTAPRDMQIQTAARLDYLTPDKRAIVRKLSIIKLGFDRNFYLEYLKDDCAKPDEFIKALVEARVLYRRNNLYYFTNSIQRVGLVHENDPAQLKQIHKKAALIINSSDTLSAEQQALLLSRNYTHAYEFENSVLWTLKAVEYLKTNHKYRLAQKIIKSSLDILDQAPANDETLTMKSSLAAARGEIEKSLGMIPASYASFINIIRHKKHLQDQKLIARAYKNLGDLYKGACDYKRGLRSLEKALKIYIELDDRIEISHTYNNMGNIYWVASDIEKAVPCYHKALEIQQELNLLKDVASTLNNLGSCYIITNQYEKTIEYYKKSVEIKKIIKDLPELARTYNNMGAVYHEMGQVHDALKYLYESLEINRRIDSTREILHNLDNIASCELTLGNYREADSISREGMDIAREIADLPFQASLLNHQGRTALETGEFGRAERILFEARGIVTQITDLDLEFYTDSNLVRLYYNINYEQDFWSNLEKTYNDSTSKSNNIGICTSQILMAQGEHTFNNNPLEAVALLDKSLVLAREIKSDSLICRNLLLRLKINDSIPCLEDKYRSELKRLIGKSSNQSLIPHYEYLCALERMNQKQFDSAREILLKACNNAEKLSQKNLLWKIKYTQGKIDREQANYENAFINLKKAVDILKGLAMTLDNKDYLKTFLSQPLAVLLKQEIGELVGKMKHKEKAAP